jgi:amino acid transporter
VAGYGGISIVGWLIIAAGAMLLAMVFARLGRAFPRTGGPHAYTRPTAVMGIPPASALAESGAPFADAADSAFGGWSGPVIAAAAVRDTGRRPDHLQRADHGADDVELQR